MGRVIVMSMIVVTIVLLMYFAGIIEGGYTLQVLKLQDPSVITTTSFWTSIQGILTITIAGIAIAAALATKSLDFTLFVSVGAVIGAIILAIVGDLILIWNELKNVNTIFATLLIGPLLLGWLFSIYDWARGRD